MAEPKLGWEHLKLVAMIYAFVIPTSIALIYVLVEVIGIERPVCYGGPWGVWG